MTVLCWMVVLSAVFMLAAGGVVFWPAGDLAKSIESDREFIDWLDAGKVAWSDGKLSSYASTTLEYHRSLKRAYLWMAGAFLASGGVSLILGAWQLILMRRLMTRPVNGAPPGRLSQGEQPLDLPRRGARAGEQTQPQAGKP